MPRPLIQHGVGRLEEIFAKGKADGKLLKQLEHELQHRQVPRAVALLSEVQAAMTGRAIAPQAPAVPAPPPDRLPALISQQHDLWGRTAIPPVVPPLASVRTVASAVRPLESPPITNASASSPAMPLEDAYKVLKATPGTTWESIEQTRRTLVHQSHPSHLKTLSAEKRTQALAEATKVNVAYAALSQTRCGGR